MPLCQILIQGTGNNNKQIPDRQYYQIGASGRYKCRVIGIDFLDQVQAGDHRLIKIRSDSFQIPYGTNRDILIPNKKDGATAHPSGEFQFNLQLNGNNIDLELIPSTTYTGNNNDAFLFCIISLEIKEFENSLDGQSDLRM